MNNSNYTFIAIIVGGIDLSFLKIVIISIAKKNFLYPDQLNK